MKESDMIQARGEFSKKVAEIYSRLKGAAEVQYNMEDVIKIYNSFAEAYTKEPVLLGLTLKMMQKETIKNDYKYLKGFYHMYHYWKSGDINDKGKVRRNLIRVYDLDGDNGLMNCQMTISPMKRNRSISCGEKAEKLKKLKKTSITSCLPNEILIYNSTWSSILYIKVVR